MIYMNENFIFNIYLRLLCALLFQFQSFFHLNVNFSTNQESFCFNYIKIHLIKVICFLSLYHFPNWFRIISSTYINVLSLFIFVILPSFFYFFLISKFQHLFSIIKLYFSFFIPISLNFMPFFHSRINIWMMQNLNNLLKIEIKVRILKFIYLMFFFYFPFFLFIIFHSNEFVLNVL